MYSLQSANLLNGLHCFFTHKCTFLRSVYDSFLIVYIHFFASRKSLHSKPRKSASFFVNTESLSRINILSNFVP